MAGNSGTNMNVRRTILAPALFLAALLLEVPFAVHAAPLADTAEIPLDLSLARTVSIELGRCSRRAYDVAW
jgi:hypothetical protein